MQSATFIETITKEILANNDDLRDVLIIIPNRRASHYIEKEIATQKQSVSWSPKIETLSNWLVAVTDAKTISNTEALFYLYEAYIQVFPEPEPFTEFFKWGKMILNDFNEIDRYLLDPKDVFKNLRDIKEIENWSFDTDELKPMQLKFHEFWLQLEPLYEKFHEVLQSKNCTTNSHLFKTIASDKKQLLELVTRYNSVYFVGFNALSSAEEIIFNAFVNAKKGKIMVDVDTYYTEDVYHEAGHFYRKIKKIWPVDMISKPTEGLLENEIQVDVVGSPNFLGQVNEGMHFLKTIDKNELKNTVLVLADEDLLWPTLCALPDSIVEANITMGLSLKWTPLQPLMNDLIALQQNHIRMGSKKGYYYKTLLPILQHPFILHLSPNLPEVIDKITTENRIYVDVDWLSEQLPETLLSNLHPWGDLKKDALTKLKELAKTMFQQRSEQNASHLEKELLFVFHEHLVKMEKLFDTITSDLDINIFKSLFFQYWHQEKIDLIGDPIDQLQIMGMLETRSLSFKNVIVLGMNEGVFPKSSRENSIIPYDLKQYLNLPLRADRDAIFANHFYRLIQRASTVFITYSTDSEGISSSEKSRYITQLEYELTRKNKNPSTKYTDSISVPGTSNAKLLPTEIEKTEANIEKIKKHLQNGLSPSAFNTYLRCSMDYYYKYVLGLGEDMELEEEISDSSFGSVVHEVIETLFTAFIGKEVLKSDVEKMLQNYEEVLKTQYDKLFVTKNAYSFGINKISYSVSKTYIEQFLKAEINRFDQEYKVGLKIIDLEKGYEYDFPLTLKDGSMITVKMKGKIDRVDQVGDTVRVIDYKSGKAESKDTKLDFAKEDKFHDKGKAHQLMMYTLMYADKDENIEAGIFSFKNMKEGLIRLSFGAKAPSKLEVNQLYLDYFSEECKKLLDTSIPFKHDVESKFCERCTV